MKVSKVLTIEEYDFYCKKYLPQKIPIWKTNDIKLKVGDCIYDYSKGNPVQRPSVHDEENIERDLGGKNVLLSDHFYYFGSKPVPLPTNLLQIVKQGQGHKSISNNLYKEKFVEWIKTFDKFKNKINSLPFGLKEYEKEDCKKIYCAKHLREDMEHEKIELFKKC